MQFRSRTQTGNGRGRHDSAGRQPVPNQPSTAWAAAQQAFSHREQGPVDKPVVVVRKGRVLDAGAAAPDGFHMVAPLPASADKPARVFRVVAAPAAEPENTGPAVQGKLQLSADMPRSSRRTRIALEKRPGPVLSIVHALPAVEAEPPVQDQVPVLVQDGVGAVIEMFASVDAILDDIKRARSFRFVDADLTSV